MADAALRVVDLKTYFKTPDGVARAVDGISFEVPRGRTFALVGESGCGKSVTALSIMQLVPQPAGYHAGGAIWIGDVEMIGLPEREKRRIRGSRVSMIFQDPMTSLNPVFTVGFQIVEAILRHERLSKAAAWERALEMLRLVRIPDAEQQLRAYPHQLSGGMKQRAMIAMALSTRPDVLIADEPTTALDVTVQAEILDLIRDLQREIGMAVLLITHDLGIVRGYANEVAVMYAGEIVERARTDALFRAPRHPYTEALFRSLPSGRKRARELEAIKGIVPRATDFPPGCRFADRCPHTLDRCRSEAPAFTAFDDDHAAACHLYAPGAPRDPSNEALPRAEIAVEEVGEPSSDETAPTSGPALVEVRDLKTYFPIRKGIFKRTVGVVRAVDGVHLRVRRGQTVAVVGESGCGKTTLGKSILRLVPTTSGEVYFEGRDVTRLSRSALKPMRSNFQMIFQDPYASLDPRMMIGETIAEGMVAHGYRAPARERRVRELMSRVGLDPSMMERYPHEFSGGQRQRVAIARALAVDPKFIVCDEPTSALDVSVQAQILNLLRDLQRELGISYLFITHDLSVVEYLADEVAVMYLGRVVEYGTTEEVFGSPKHPYTKALLSAIPKVDGSGVRKIHLEGDVPSPVHPPAGCHFHTRCPEALDRCAQSYPGITRFGATHMCRCFLHESDATPASPDAPLS